MSHCCVYTELNEMSKKIKDEIDFTSEWAYANICFRVEAGPVYANKMILSMWSPVYEAMFCADFKEKDAKEIPLPGKKLDDIIELMKVLHPPNKDINDENVLRLLPLVQEYQINHLLQRCEEHLLQQANSIKNLLIAQQFGLEKLKEANMSYIKRAPISRLQKSPEFDQLDKELLLDTVLEKCTKFEAHLESLREIRMVLERKKPTTFPGVSLLCDGCTGAREQQVDCVPCMKSCCAQLTEVLRNLER